MTTPIAEWLRTTRQQQLREDGEPWSQDDFLRELEADTGWHLHRPSYSNYETGKATPSRESLGKLIAFWTHRGSAAPDFTPRPAEASLEERTLAALERQAAAMERQAAAAEAQIRLMRLFVPDGHDPEALAAVDAELAAIGLRWMSGLPAGTPSEPRDVSQPQPAR